MHKLVELQKKFDKSGINGNPVISDAELKILHEGLNDMERFFLDRGDNTIANAMRQEAWSVSRMIEARKYP